MKQIFFIATIFLSIGITNAQTTFSEDTDVIAFMKDKTFVNYDLGIELEYGYISQFNTYGITLKNTKNGNKQYYFNCDIKAYGSFADISGMSVTDNSNFRFRLYKNRIIVGVGEEKQVIFYRKQNQN
jgi:hypothetical protein